MCKSHGQFKLLFNLYSRMLRWTIKLVVYCVVYMDKNLKKQETKNKLAEAF